MVTSPPVTGLVPLAAAVPPTTAADFQQSLRRPLARLLVPMAQAAAATLVQLVAAVPQSGAAAAIPGAVPEKVAAARGAALTGCLAGLREYWARKSVAVALVVAAVPMLVTLALGPQEADQPLASVATKKVLRQQPRASGIQPRYHEAQAPLEALPVVRSVALLHWRSVRRDRQRPRQKTAQGDSPRTALVGRYSLS